MIYYCYGCGSEWAWNPSFPLTACGHCDGALMEIHVGLDDAASGNPTRQFDYSAVVDDYAPGAPQGHGTTADEAVADLIAQLND